MKLKSCCFGFNLDDLPYKIRAPHAMLHVQIMVFDNKPYKLVMNPKFKW